MINTDSKYKLHNYEDDLKFEVSGNNINSEHGLYQHQHDDSIINDQMRSFDYF